MMTRVVLPPTPEEVAALEQELDFDTESDEDEYLSREFDEERDDYPGDEFFDMR